MAVEKGRRAIHLDELMPRLGQPGKFQVFIFILLTLNYFPVCFNHVIMAFYGSTPQHKCVAKDLENDTNVNVVSYGKCFSSYSVGNVENRTIKCEDAEDHGIWSYTGTSERESTIITEWDLVCGKVYLGKLATTIYFCGVMVGGLAFGHVADFFGRKPVMLACLYIPILLGFSIYFVQTYTQFVIIRFFLGFLIQGLQTSTFALVMELSITKYRGYVGAVFECFWGAGVLSLAGIAYAIQDWRYMQLAISLPSLLAIFYICVIPESPRWLIMKGRFDEADSVIRRLAKINKVQYPADVMEAFRKQGLPDNKPATYTLLDLMRTPRIRSRTFLLFFMWFVTSTGYYGLTFQITSLAGNKYLNFFIGALVEMLAYIVVVYVIKKFGRRKPLTFYFLVGGVSCIIAGCMPFAGKGDDISKIATSFAIIGRFGMGGVFSVMVLYTSELYPTVIRNIGMGSCFFWTRVGGLVAPQVLLLGDVTHKSVPLIAFGVLSSIGGLLTLFLPETLGRKLPDTIQDAENLKGIGKLPKAEKYKEQIEDKKEKLSETNLGYTAPEIETADQTRL